MRKMWSTNASRRLFINAALAKLHEQGYDGYNLDIEVGASDGKHGGLIFVTEFAEALHQVGAQLSVDIGNCPGRDSMGTTCAEYKASPMDKIFTMSTYFWWPPPHNERPNTTTYAKKDIPVLGDKYGMGLATGRSSGLQPTDNSSLAETFRFLESNPSVGTLGIWANNPSPDFMAQVGGWLRRDVELLEL